MPTAPINGIEMYYEVHGSGLPIVFAHGRGGNHFSWWQQLADFSPDYKCIVFDHRGWGLTSDLTNGPGTQSFADDLESLLNHLDIEKTALVSQSMGGITNLNFTLKCPNRVSALVLGDTTGGIGDSSVVDLLEDVHPPEHPLGRALSTNFMEHNPDKTTLFQQIGLLNPTMPISVVSQLFRNPDGPQKEQLSKMTTPTLLIVGREDLIFPPHVMEAASKLIPNSSLEIVSNAAHSTHFEQPEEFNRLVRQLLVNVADWS